MYTDKAQSIVSFINICFHTTITYCIVSIAYKYFKYERGKAQLVCIMLLTNTGIGKMYHLAYNDCLYIFYLSLALYNFFITRNLTTSAIFISLGLGIKTSMYAVFPSLFGCIQWQYGTIPLIKFVMIIVIIHVITAAPFIFFDGKTKVYDYLQQSTLMPSHLKVRAAGQPRDSVFFRWLAD